MAFLKGQGATPSPSVTPLTLNKTLHFQAMHFTPEDGNSMLLRNDGTYYSTRRLKQHLNFSECLKIMHLPPANMQSSISSISF